MMRDQMIPELVLSRLRSRDVLYILQIDSDPEDEIKRIAVNGRHVGFEKEITNIFRDSIHSIEQPPKYRGSTNLGGVLAFAARTAQELQAKDGPPVQVIVLVFSDGKLEGSQSGHRQEWPEGMQVWFWGVEPAQEAALKEWTTKKMALGEERLTIVRWSDWQTMAAVFGTKTGRRLQDVQVVQQLHTSGATSLAVNTH